MNDGRPVFTQDEIDDLPKAEDDTSVPSNPRPEVDVVGNRLKFSVNYGFEPTIAGQAILYPESVRVVGEKYRLFDVANTEDMEEFSKIRMSHLAGGRWKITSDEMTKWCEQRSTMLVALRIQERMFKTLSTTTLVPED